MSKTNFVDGDPSQGILGTVVTADYLNTLNNHHHTGLDEDGHGALPYALDSGAANAYIVNLTPALSAYVNGMPIFFKAANGCTGASTVNINGLGAKPIKKNGSADLIAGDIAAGQIVGVSYDGINMQLISPPQNATYLWDGTAGRSASAAPEANTVPVRNSDGQLLDLHNLLAGNWTERSNPKNITLNSVAWNGSLFVAVGDGWEWEDTDTYLITSPDGITWTERSNPKCKGLSGVVWNGSLFVAVGGDDGTDAYIVTSPDGITWTERSNPKNMWLDAVAWNGSLFVAVGDGNLDTDAYLITSPDGITWTERSNPKNIGLSDIAWNGSLFVAVGHSDGTDAYLITSPDGITWTEGSNPKNSWLTGVAWNGSLFVAVGESDGTDAYLITSPDGITWTERSNPKNMWLGAVAWNGSLFVAVGDGNLDTDAYLITSPDGITWMERSTPKNIALNHVAWNGSLFVAVGAADGTDAFIITSLRSR